MSLTSKLPRAVADLFSLIPSDYVLSKTLAAGVAEQFLVPASAEWVLFSADANFYANYTTTATVPGDVTDGTASPLNPSMRRLRLQDGTHIDAISVIAPAATQITAEFYLASA